MSMISAQIDELRERAKVLRQGRWSDGADDARLMEEAADTIWQLRDDLQRAHRENAKLRELARDMWEACPTDGYYCIYHCEHYDKESESHCKLEDRMAELGIEVDE